MAGAFFGGLCAFGAAHVLGHKTEATPPLTHTASTPAPASSPLIGRWRNERGSELVITSASTAALVGTFQSAVGRVDPQAAFPIVGVARGDVVAFSVDFGAVGSVASWAGQVDTRGDEVRLVTQWHLVRDVPDADERDKMWSSTLSGADVFVLIKP